jgi:hypothetical protein
VYHGKRTGAEDRKDAERENMNAPEIIEATKICASGGEAKCHKCPYRLRHTLFRTCSENLMLDSHKLMKEQEKLIAKFGKMFMA